jgi:hypothetical protein
MRLLTIEQLTDIPLFALRAQLRLDLHRADQEQVEADVVWLARQEDEVAK